MEFCRVKPLPARWRIEKRTLAGFAIAVALLLIIGAISYRTIRELAESNSKVTQSHRVLEHLFELNLDFDDLENSARNFVITGDEAYFKAFNAGVKKLRETFSELQSLTSPNWDQRQRLDRLRPLIEHRLFLAQKLIKLRRSAGNQAMARMTESGSGDEIVPEIRSGIKGMEVAQNDLLIELDSQAQQSANHTIAALTAGCILVLLVFCAAAFINHRDMSRLRKSDQALWQSQSSLQDFLDFANDLIYSVSADGSEVN
jgi:CHASE3 domain sensor protein